MTLPFFKSGSNIEILNCELTEAARQFKKWCDLNRLTLNLSKSKTLLPSGFSAKKTNKLN